MSGTRDENVFMARLAEQAERFEDMVVYMKAVANMGCELSLEERNLLSVAYKNSVGARRSAARQIAGMMRSRQAETKQSEPQSVHDYKEQVERELNANCEEILTLLRKDGGLIATASTVEAKVFYQKMEGDYHRYLAELSASAETHAANAYNAYAQATQAATQMKDTHPIKLGLALNFSVFYYEVYGQADAACQLARTAFDGAMSGAHDFESEDQQRDAQAILSLLKDNLILWEQGGQDAGDGGRPPDQDGTRCEDL